MKITSLEIKQHEFEKSFRGYDIEEVDIFLTNIANEWERISNENKMLRMQLEIAEKEATKLREVEMTLIKTLRSAEDTSSKITDHAKFEASKTVEDAKALAQNTVNDAKSTAENTINDAEQQAQLILENARIEATEILTAAQSEVSEAESKRIEAIESLEGKLNGLNSEKVEILAKLKAIHSQTAIALENIEEGIVLEALVAPKAKKVEVEAIVEEEEEILSVASSANSLKLEDEHGAKDNLEIIEGIGPKIAELLHDSGINTYRELATTPVYKIKETLTSAGPHFAMHDPTTWVQQGLLAAEGKFNELDELKEYLIAGRKPEVELSEEIIAKVEPKSEEVTEEMLDRVNKVKAALRKAMQDKEAVPTKNDSTPKTETLNDLIGKQRNVENGGSFFDNIN